MPMSVVARLQVCTWVVGAQVFCMRLSGVASSSSELSVDVAVEFCNDSNYSLSDTVYLAASHVCLG